MKPIRQARSTRPAPPRVAGFVLLCLASLLAGCFNDGAAPSIPPASTQQAEPQETAENTGQGTNEAEAPTPARTESEPEAESLYALQPTLRCLERRPRLAVSTTATTPRLQALRDLAQRTSVIAQLEGESVGIAVVQSSAHASLVAELLRAPEDPHRIVRRRNAVLLFLRERGTCLTSWWVVFARKAKAGCSSPPAAVRAGCPRTLPPANQTAATQQIPVAPNTARRQQ